MPPFINPFSNNKAQDAQQPLDSVDAPYAGLPDELERETLSHHQIRHLSFIRWGLKNRKGRFTEWPDEATEPEA